MVALNLCSIAVYMCCCVGSHTQLRSFIQRFNRLNMDVLPEYNRTTLIGWYACMCTCCCRCCMCVGIKILSNSTTIWIHGNRLQVNSRRCLFISMISIGVMCVLVYGCACGAWQCVGCSLCLVCSVYFVRFFVLAALPTIRVDTYVSIPASICLAAHTSHIKYMNI